MQTGGRAAGDLPVRGGGTLRMSPQRQQWRLAQCTASRNEPSWSVWTSWTSEIAWMSSSIVVGTIRSCMARPSADARGNFTMDSSPLAMMR